MRDEAFLEKIAEIIDARVALLLEPIKTVQEEHSKEFKGVTRKLNRTSKDLHIVIKQFDKRIVENTHDIDHIKTHIRLTS